MTQLVVDLRSVGRDVDQARLQVIMQVVDSTLDRLLLRSLVESTQTLALTLPEYIPNSFYRGDVLKVDCLYTGDFGALDVLEILKLDGDLTLLNKPENLELLQRVGHWT